MKTDGTQVLVKLPLVLIVDDLPENIQIIGNALKNEEYDLVFATSGAEALAITAEEHPDLILLDVMMPEMDGFAVCERLKADVATKEIPVIFITAFTETEAVIKGFFIFRPAILTARLDIKKHLPGVKYRAFFTYPPVNRLAVRPL